MKSNLICWAKVNADAWTILTYGVSVGDCFHVTVNTFNKNSEGNCEHTHFPSATANCEQICTGSGSWTCFLFWPLIGPLRWPRGLDTVLHCTAALVLIAWLLPSLHLSPVNRPPAHTLSACWIYGQAEYPHPANYRWLLRSGCITLCAPQHHSSSVSALAPMHTSSTHSDMMTD